MAGNPTKSSMKMERKSEANHQSVGFQIHFRGLVDDLRGGGGGLVVLFLGCSVMGSRKKPSFIGLFGWRLHCYCSLFWLINVLFGMTNFVA